jgi:hypothetical protein
MIDLLAGLLAVIIEAVLKVFTSQFFVKAILATFTYVFLFAIIPLLIQFLVPSSIMGAIGTYQNMLSGGQSSLSCSGTQPITALLSVSCSTALDMTQWGQGIAYILSFFQMTAAFQCLLPAMAVSFLFKRI